MKKVDLAIKKYNDSLPFYKFKSKMKNDCFFAGAESASTNQPILIKKQSPEFTNASKLEIGRKRDIHIYGNKNRAISYYKNYILGLIEENEPFIFINNIFSSDFDFLIEIKKHAIEFNYSHEILINDYFEFLEDDSKEVTKSYIFNLFFEEKNTELIEYFLLKEDLVILDVYDVLMTKIINHYYKFFNVSRNLSFIVGIYKEPKILFEGENIFKADFFTQLSLYLSRYHVHLVTYIEKEGFMNNDSFSPWVLKEYDIGIYFDITSEIVNKMRLDLCLLENKSRRILESEIKLHSNYFQHHYSIYEIK